MRKIEIDGEVYRLPDKLNDFQFELFIHLIKWKWKNITKEPGHHGGDDYDAILPESEHENLPHLYNQSIKDALAEHLGIFPFKLHRHFFHMASSQAANINLFLPILLHPHANEILKQLKSDFKSLATEELYHGFRLEFWDGNLDTDRGSLGDHSAIAGTDSDIAIAYYNHEDKLCLWLIEHKLREDEFTECGGFKSKGKRDQHDCTKSFGEILQNKDLCYYRNVNRYKYWDVTEENKAFFVNHQEHQSCPFKGGMNQLWRNQLLGFTLEDQKKYNEVYFSVVRHPANDSLDKTINSYKKLIASNPKFFDFTSKDVIDSSEKFDDKELNRWVKWYRELYNLK